MDWDGFGCLRLASLFFRSGAARRWCFFHLFPIPLYPVHSRSIIFPSYSHPFPSFSHPCPSTIFRWLAGSATGKVAGPARKWWVACWFAVFFSKTPGGHRVDTMPYEWTRLPHTNPYKWNPSTVLKWAPMLVYADSFCRLGTGLPHEPIWIIWIHLDSFGFIWIHLDLFGPWWIHMNPYESIYFLHIYILYIYIYIYMDRPIYLSICWAAAGPSAEVAPPEKQEHSGLWECGFPCFRKWMIIGSSGWWHRGGAV